MEMSNYSTINISENCDNISAHVSSTYNIVGSGAKDIRIDVAEGVKAEFIDFSIDCNFNIYLQKNSTAKIVLVKLMQSKSEYHVHIVGEGANFELFGVSIANAANNISITTMVHHEKGNAQSYQYIKCVGADSSYTKFEGTVHIVEGAGGSSAYQQNKNILLSDTAQIVSRPWLEIYADDVKCSHGSTTGMINEDEIFYMRQRGISLLKARKLQMHGFALDIVKNITNETLQKEASEKIINKIESI
ncbi:MAG: SufD family Fe-S cluster assembly protein [Rikenellaceae bacterium]